MQTQSANTEDSRDERRWYVVDVEDLVLGRVATRIATILRGKHKTNYTPHVDTGDFVIVVNAAKVKLTGKKEAGKKYYYHTRWVGGVVESTAAELRKKHPEQLIEDAVRGMLPKGNLGRHMRDKLKVYAGAEHPHKAQQPQALTF